MPSISNSSPKILVSGANGFIGTWIVRVLLKRGYSVRAAVRNEAKGKPLLEAYRSYGDKLQLWVVGDIGKDGAFDEAVQGVDGIIHAASPINVTVAEPKEIIQPAVKGVVGMLTSAFKHGSSVQRIVFTSSCAAILPLSVESVTVSEMNWNEASIIECDEKGKDASRLSKYSASKTLAEKAAWDFYEKHKSEVNWDISVINPPWVFGPVIHDVTTVDTLNSSCKRWYDALAKGDFGGYSPLTSPGHGWADVRDVAEAHVRALEVPAAGSERIIICAGSFVWQDWLDVANSMSPYPWPSNTLAIGTPGAIQRAITFDTSKEKEILGIKFKTMEELTRDTLADYERRGW
ncbi:NAD(P)-binding protein [Lipomyces orientalis]|uniref:NAD(P)-binding protein n=1 Tax=Lipomyces orientalis TaxID=1233043 RepID=A0ACC3TN53_9ASCO